MVSGGDIGWPIRTLIQMECQKVSTQERTACQQEVTKKLEKEVDNLCRSAFRSSKPLQKECATALRQTIWVNPRDLKRKLKGMMKSAADHLPPHFQNSFTFTKTEAQPFQATPIAPPVDRQPTPPQRNEEPSQVVWEAELGRVDDTVTGDKFQFTHVQEWRPVSMKINHQAIDWSYWLQSNEDGTYTVFWRMNNKTTNPTAEDQQLVFHLQNGEYPSNLILQVKENQKIQLALKANS